MGFYRVHSFSARGKIETLLPHHGASGPNSLVSDETPIPQQAADPICFARVVSNSRNASRATAAGRARPPTHQTSPPLQPPTAATAAAAAAADGEDERGRAVRGADGAGVRRGGPAGRGRAGVAVPVRGGAPAACLDLLLPPPLQRPLPVPPGPVSEWFPSPYHIVLWHLFSGCGSAGDCC